MGEERSDEWKVVSYSDMQHRVVATLLPSFAPASLTSKSGRLRGS